MVKRKTFELRSVFLVRGETGEYSDQQQWTVRAFGTQEEADAFRMLCEEHLHRKPNERDFGTEYDKWVASHPHDPQFAHDYTGTTYSVEQVPFGADDSLEG